MAWTFESETPRPRRRHRVFVSIRRGLLYFVPVRAENPQPDFIPPDAAD
jgi:hypothetical protein